MKVTTQKGLEDILFSQELLTKDEVAAVKLERVKTGRSAEEIIAERELVGEEDLVKARGELYGIDYVDLIGVNITGDILDLIPQKTSQKNNLIPFKKEGGVLHLAMADPLDLQVIEFVEKKTGLKVVPHIARPSLIERMIAEQYGKSLGQDVSEVLEEFYGTEKIEEQIKDLKKAEKIVREAPVARVVGLVLEYAIKSRASDIHIEPSEEDTRIRYRIDGVLHDRHGIPRQGHDSIIARIKILCHMKIDEKRKPQDGRFKVQVGEVKTDVRVSTLPTVFGEKVVMRLLKQESAVRSLKDLGLRGTALKRIEEALLKPNGMILVTGPTGSGKTMTLATALAKVNTVRVNIITVEDPVEIRIPGTNQVQVNATAGLTFASGLRSILRQDPNIIMIGEIRDNETAQLTIHAALTGHLVLSTLHTNSAAGAIPRFLDMGAENFLLASTLVLVLAQRLVRQICEHCKESYPAPDEVAENVRQVLGELIPPEKKKGKLELYRGKGCDKCDRQGYTGRTGVFEVMPISDRINRMIVEHKSETEISKVAVEEGMVTLIQDGYLKALEGITTVEETVMVAEE